MSRWLKDQSWRFIVWLMKAHTRWDERSTLTITTNVPTEQEMEELSDKERTKYLALKLVDEAEHLLNIAESTLDKKEEDQNG